MTPSDHFLCAPSITENLLKRKWSVTILQHLRSGTTSAAQIMQLEKGLSVLALSERLRTLLRYGMILRHPRHGRRTEVINYRLTPKGRRILTMLELIDQLDELSDQDPRSLEEVLRTNLGIKSDQLPAPSKPKRSPSRPVRSPEQKKARMPAA